MLIHAPTREAILSDWARSGGDKKAFASAQATLRGVSERTIYRVLERTGRRDRRSSGPRTMQDPGDMALAVALTAQLDLNTEMVRDILETNGRALPSASTVRRRIRQETGLTRRKIRQMTSSKIKVLAMDSIRQKADRSNRIWQLDFTVSEQYYIDASGAIAEWSPLTHSRNKAEKDQVKLWLYSVVDDHSSCVFAWFYAGLSSRNAVDFLVRAMARKGPDLLADQPGAPAWLRTPGIAPEAGADRMDWFGPGRCPLCGVPEAILTDNDAILKSADTLFKQAVERRLGVEIVHHLPGHSWVKGKVENSFSVMAEYQKVTKLQRFGDLFSANAALVDWLVRLNARRGSSAAWVNGLGGKPVRLLTRDDLVKRLFLRRIEAFLDNQVSFSYHGTRVYLPREERFRLLVGDRIEVILSDRWQEGDEVAVVLDGREEWVMPVSPIVVNTGDQYHALPKLQAQELVEQAKAADLSGLKLTGAFHDLARYSQEYTVPTGESYRPESLQPVKGALRGLLFAVRRFQEEGLFSRPVKEEERSWLRLALFATRDEIYDADLEDFLRDVKSGKWNVGDGVAMFG